MPRILWCVAFLEQRTSKYFIDDLHKFVIRKSDVVFIDKCDNVFEVNCQSFFFHTLCVLSLQQAFHYKGEQRATVRACVPTRHNTFSNHFIFKLCTHGYHAHVRIYFRTEKVLYNVTESLTYCDPRKLDQYPMLLSWLSCHHVMVSVWGRQLNMFETLYKKTD